MSTGKRIVILGAGYAGLRTALLLNSNPAARRRADILLVDRNPYHLLKTELHAIATGALKPDNAALPLSRLLRNTAVKTLLAEITVIDTDNNLVRAGDKSLRYDILVLAPGSITTTYGIPGMDRHAMLLNSLEDAMAIRRRLDEIIAEARGGAADAGRRIIVAGAGADGVETAAYLMDRFKREKLGARLTPEVSLVEAAQSILPNGKYTRSIRKQAMAHLTGLGVRPRLGNKVSHVEEGVLHLGEGAPLNFAMLVWAGGVVADKQLVGQAPAPLGPMSRVEVTDRLQLAARPNVFVLGDAALTRFGSKRKPLPCAAQYAIQQADVVAHNISVALTGLGTRRRFTPNMQGEFVSIGGGGAIGWAGPLEIIGRDAQLLKDAILAKYLLSIGVNIIEWFATGRER